jgi:hypothetical protein
MTDNGPFSRPADEPVATSPAEERPREPLVATLLASTSDSEPLMPGVSTQHRFAKSSTFPPSRNLSSPQQQHYHHQGHMYQHLSHQEQRHYHLCPPFGSKAVIGRRAKMEDACVAVPYLLEVPIAPASLDELHPPRLAPQLRSNSGSDRSSATAGCLSLSIGEGAGNPGSPGLEFWGSHGLPVLATLESEVETLHFFGVFDGHGGADAALHCAQTMHERVRQVLSAFASSSPGSPEKPGPEGSSSNTAGVTPCNCKTHSAPLSSPAPGGSSSPSEYADACADIGSASSGTSDFMDACESEEASTRRNKVDGLACTAETIEVALTKAFRMTGECPLSANG